MMPIRIVMSITGFVCGLDHDCLRCGMAGAGDRAWASRRTAVLRRTIRDALRRLSSLFDFPYLIDTTIRQTNIIAG
jgi:hypothetical protein